MILTNIWGIHHDDKRWSEPEKFMPERFLDDEGKFKKSDNWLLYNVGARDCIGQKLANMEVFITTTMLFRRFAFSFESDFEPNMNGMNDVTLHPHPFTVCAKIR